MNSSPFPRLGTGDLHLFPIFVDSFQTEFDREEVVTILRGDAQTLTGLTRGGRSTIRLGDIRISLITRLKTEEMSFNFIDSVECCHGRVITCGRMSEIDQCLDRVRRVITIARTERRGRQTNCIYSPISSKICEVDEEGLGRSDTI
jgi:hypothetical protein